MEFPNEDDKYRVARDRPEGRGASWYPRLEY